MNSLFLALIASCCSSCSAFCFRKNVSFSNNSSSGYLVLFYFFSFFLSILLSPQIWNIPINLALFSMGVCVGLLNSTLMMFISKALRCGPSGLTYAFLNASAVFPGLILFFLLGNDFGFACSPLQLVGMSFVLCGLFFGAKKKLEEASPQFAKWLKYAFICFIIQIFALTCIQGRCIFSFPQTEDVWFMPGQFGASFTMQLILFLREKRSFEKNEIFFSSIGGLANFGSTGLLLLATKFALPFEKGIIFPCFAVTSMILSNLWANRIYKERFNYKTNALCSLGTFIAVLS